MRLARERVESIGGDHRIGLDGRFMPLVPGDGEAAQITVAIGEADQEGTPVLLTANGEAIVGQRGGGDCLVVAIRGQDVEDALKRVTLVMEANRLDLDAAIGRAPDRADFGFASGGDERAGQADADAGAIVAHQPVAEPVAHLVALGDHLLEEGVGHHAVGFEPGAGLKIANGAQCLGSDAPVERAVIVSRPGEARLEADAEGRVGIVIIGRSQIRAGEGLRCHGRKSRRRRAEHETCQNCLQHTTHEVSPRISSPVENAAEAFSIPTR